MNEMTQLMLAVAWLRARIDLARGNESGASSVEWLLILIGGVAIAGVAVVGVTKYVTGKSNDLNGGR